MKLTLLPSGLQSAKEKSPLGRPCGVNLKHLTKPFINHVGESFAAWAKKLLSDALWAEIAPLVPPTLLARRADGLRLRRAKP